MSKYNHNQPPLPPRMANRLLEWFYSPHLLEEVQGDLHELYGKWVEKYGEKKANRLYVYHTIKFFRPFALKRRSQTYHLNTIDMLKNYFKIALRNFWRQKGYSFINISGLSLGLACSLLILLWVQDELSFDQFHEKGNALYLVMKNDHYSDGQLETNPGTPGPLSEVLEEEVPEIENITRVTYNWEKLFTVEEKNFKEQGYYADSTFFEIFSFPLIAGDQKTALNDVSSIAISESLAQKYFGSVGHAMGKTIRLDHQEDYRVSGIFEDTPKNSTLQFDFILPFQVFWKTNKHIQSWGNNFIRTYVQLHPDASSEKVSAKIKDFVNQKYQGADTELFLYPFERLYLTNFEGGKPSGGRIVMIRLFAIIAVFILLIACINFMNLATARSSQRAKEVGIRKVVGAGRTSLIRQFMSESVLTTFLSMVVALLLVELILPAFNQLTGKLMIVPYGNPNFLIALAGLTLFTGILAGSYPAFFLSSFNSVKVLKGTFIPASGASHLRQGLVVFQFALSIVLITGTLVVYQQIQYIKNKDLGVDLENLVYFEGNPGIMKHFEVYKNELLQMAGIQLVTTSSASPIEMYNNTTWLEWEGKNPDDNISFNIVQVGYDFLETAGIALKEGRTFSPTFSTDTANVIINEEAARSMGMQDPLGKRMKVWRREGNIIGVVKDFHNQDLHTPIPPLIITLRPEDTRMVLVRTKAGETQAAIASLEKLHQKYDKEYPFEYHFVDQDFEQMYRTDTLIGQLAGYFGFLAISISCLGLFGLASYTAERRTKEMGIRKVLGASVQSLVALLTRSYTKLILLAFIIAIPIAWLLANQFLQEYAYRIELSPGLFLLAGILILLIAWLTVSYQSIKAALANPVDALRDE